MNILLLVLAGWLAGTVIIMIVLSITELSMDGMVDPGMMAFMVVAWPIATPLIIISAMVHFVLYMIREVIRMIRFLMKLQFKPTVKLIFDVTRGVIKPLARGTGTCLVRCIRLDFRDKYYSLYGK